MKEEMGSIEYNDKTYYVRYDTDRAKVDVLIGGETYWTEVGMASYDRTEIMHIAKDAIKRWVLKGI